jgi:hypothetical protein
MSNLVLLLLREDQTFLLFHLGDTFFFWNELVKAQATSRDENEIFGDYGMGRKRNERFYGRCYVSAVCLPFFVSLFKKSSYFYKLATAYVLYSCIDALYDMGVYTHFFVHAPKYMRRMIALPGEENFGSIQTHLFMRYCATKEIKKATGETPKKMPWDLVFMRSLKNQLRDQGVRVKNYATIYGIIPSSKGPRN